MDVKAHWDAVYEVKAERDMSWFEAVPATSLAMLERAGLTVATCVLDVGGGASRLVDALLARGMVCLAVLDISGVALTRTRERLGQAASIPMWIESDVLGGWSLAPVDIWHDRAVFHFLTTVEDRGLYRAHLATTLKPGGSAIIATFAPDGPAKCSGLPVVRYSPESLAIELGEDFTLQESAPHLHLTPRGTTQSFQFSRFRRTR